ncbi:glyoxalase [Paraburkholderia sp. Ac-20336]|uniref:VOC family protein n=1 Tax=Burkholderiaceae TaxID=119060 RepID=UPI001422B79E|nr:MULTISPECIES: VOC family protein [Burkholderiaceae]MBN3804802.1 glyoxalase [Paraburkholderia sp. Ac-20336]MBN3845970.1 glyoxalase [Paraburkholderia sp. Ac-20342]NIF54109.1 glyoxalase [Burkholderia sp. Ax-1724]NIF77778.1 glyoxalase [Paraburkholderia sp. Cy-641]
MSELSSLGYTVFQVSNLRKWEDFAVDVLGLMAGQRNSGSLGLRMDEYAQRILLEEGRDDDIAAAGWQFDTEDELHAYITRLKSTGLPVRDGGKDLAASRQVERVFCCDDPNGFVHEFYCGPTYAPGSAPFHSARLKGAGFETGRLGMGHILPVSKDYVRSLDFYKNVLGLRISDTIRDSHTMPGVMIDATFFHTRTGRHHSLATASMPFPKRLHHVLLEVQSIDDVGMAYDRCLNAGLTIHAGLGHHPNDQMFSFYVQTPSGFGLEYGYGGVVIDDLAWEVKNYSQLSDWGHRPPAMSV